MKLSRKLRKLFSREIFASGWEHANRMLHPVNSRRILATVDQAEFEKLRERYPYRPGSAAINRFEDAAYWIEINAERAQDLWLDRSPPLQILDLGCGAGYFLYICKFFGHNARGLDTDEEPLFRATIALLNVPRVVGRIQRQQLLPDLGHKFDLVAAHRICFNRLGRARDGDWNEWATDDWQFFINDLRNRFLNPGGRILLDFNPRPDRSSFFTPELRAFFLGQGARILRSKALLGIDPAQRPRFKQTRSR